MLPENRTYIMFNTMVSQTQVIFNVNIHLERHHTYWWRFNHTFLTSTYTWGVTKQTSDIAITLPDVTTQNDDDSIILFWRHHTSVASTHKLMTIQSYFLLFRWTRIIPDLCIHSRRKTVMSWLMHPYVRILWVKYIFPQNPCICNKITNTCSFHQTTLKL